MQITAVGGTEQMYSQNDLNRYNKGVSSYSEINSGFWCVRLLKWEDIQTHL